MDECKSCGKCWHENLNAGMRGCQTGRKCWRETAVPVCQVSSPRPTCSWPCFVLPFLLYFRRLSFWWYISLTIYLLFYRQGWRWIDKRWRQKGRCKMYGLQNRTIRKAWSLSTSVLDKAFIKNTSYLTRLSSSCQTSDYSVLYDNIIKIVWFLVIKIKIKLIVHAQ